jgi:hypothetical protein
MMNKLFSIKATITNNRMRKEWFEYVRSIREKESRKRRRTGGKKASPCSHREAMKIASQSWAKEKAKLLKRRKVTPPVVEITDEEKLN